MLKVSHISKSYDKLKAVDDLSFEVDKGEIFGLLGVNGAGKTTTFRMIIGLLSPDKGEITLDNKKIDYSLTDNIGFLTEEKSLLTKMSVIEQVLFYGKLKNMDKNTIIKRLDYYLEKLDIKDYKYKKIKELSKGNQQKIQFISAIINNPKLLILDEPFTGLDPFNVNILMNLLREMAKSGTIIIFASHRMEHVEAFCDKLIILVKGKSILQGSLKEIKDGYLKKVIHVIGDINIKDIKSIKGVENITNNNDEYIINVSSNSVASNIFNIIKKSKNITKFAIEDPTLNDIFIEKVGELNE
ncbi:MAG: ATP-binding cassette domain-containing protein [Bacilli bacterium]|nr:ATP-binding cassette domain-containing protein [Bacilli bacterium]